MRDGDPDYEPEAGREAPIPGRCGFKSQSGFCRSYPLKGATRCKLHGGAAVRFWDRLKRVDKVARQEVEAALKDPDLMDVRRAIAVGETLLTGAPLIPTDEAVARLAQRRLAGQFPGELLHAMKSVLETPDAGPEIAAVIRELLEPGEPDLDDARMALHERSMRLVNAFSQRQIEGVKALEWTKVIREQALPFLAELGLRLTAVIKRHVPEDRQPAALEDGRKAIVQTIASLATARDK